MKSFFPDTMASSVIYAAVKLEVLVENKTVSWATGFIIDEKDFLSLYTCWHIVTGCDPHKLPKTLPEKRTRLKIHTQIETKQNESVTSYGGSTQLSIDLYDQGSKPIWFQGEPQEGTENGEIPVPNWDCIRININQFRNDLIGWFHPTDQITRRIDVCHPVHIVGYPYGYSANESGPEPVFLGRHVASSTGPRFYTLLDGAGARGMSGSPVIAKHEGKWKLIGIYCGTIFPESAHFRDDLYGKDGKSDLPLGKFIDSIIARGVVGAPVYEKN